MPPEDAVPRPAGWLAARMKWILLVSGALTCSMLLTALAPQAALRAIFGETITGPVAEIVVRNWGALIALVGAMLIYSAYRPASRPLVLIVASASKLIFISLVLIYGRPFLGHQAGGAVVGDALMVVVFLTYLLTHRESAAA